MDTMTILKIILAALLCLPLIWLAWHFFWKLFDEFVKKPGGGGSPQGR